MGNAMAGTISSLDMQHKLQGPNVGEGKDMISNLPDCILHYILSLLPTKHAVRTSILAKRWRYLWTNLPVFDFETYYLRKSDQNQKSANCLLDLVDRLLHNSNHMERLCIKIQGITLDSDRCNSLISSTLKHKVQDLKLSLEYLNATFALPHSFSASESLTKLCLEFRFTLYIPSGIRFPSLKTLQLSSITFANEESVQRLFSGCPVLQELYLSKCYWTNIKHISVAISTLRVFTIGYDYDISRAISNDRRDCTIKIDAENLLSLNCIGCPPVEFVFVNLTSIVDAFVDLVHYFFIPNERHVAHCAIEILNGLSNVKSLSLSCNTLKCLSYAKDTLHVLPMFHNLRQLFVFLENSNFTSEVLMDILLKTPKLEVLCIPKGFDLFLGGGDWTLNSLPCCFKSSLKFFCISEFDGDEVEIQMVKFLSENATVLTEIKIFYSEDLLADLEKLADVRNQLQPVGLGSCVLKLKLLKLVYGTCTLRTESIYIIGLLEIYAILDNMGMAGTISSPDMQKLQRPNVGDGKYMISNLPDCILHYILSLLPTKHAVRTSILAKRWRYLWTRTNLSAFHLGIYQYKSDQKQKSADCLLYLVERLLHNSNHMERLYINIEGIIVDADKVNSLISSTLKHKIQDLKLSLEYLNALFVLPHSFSASESLTKLCLKFRFTLYIPIGIRFPSLKMLELSSITFANEESVQRLFSGCPVLQELTLSGCYWMNIKHISAAISTLRVLTISYGYDISCVKSNGCRDCTVKIDVENILSLSCTSCPPLEFVLVNMTSIVDAFVDLDHYCFKPNEPHVAHCAIEILSGFSSVKSLCLSCNTLECIFCAKDTLHVRPMFHNLTHLYVFLENSDFISEVLMDILPKTPKLDVLYIPKACDLFLGGGDWTLNSLPCCFKSSLKLFCISEFDGDEAGI